jgi:DNA/RNA-binding domain of Phe-tRNA-synthetase-like protein
MRYTNQFIIGKGIEELGLKGIYFKVEGLRNAEYHPEFEPILENEINLLNNGLERGPEWIKQDRILAGFRNLHERTGASNRKNLSAPENLLKTVAKHHTIPRINLLVDIYNTISIKYKLALGAHDLAAVQGDIYLRLTSGTEKYVPLGSTEPKEVPANHYSYIDSSNEVLCYLDVRQVIKSLVSPKTTDVFFVVQGNAETSFQYIKCAADELIALTKRFCGGTETTLGCVENSATSSYI